MNYAIPFIIWVEFICMQEQECNTFFAWLEFPMHDDKSLIQTELRVQAQISI